MHCRRFLFWHEIFLFQLNISFNDKTEVFEYPSFESVSSISGNEEISTDAAEKEEEDAPHNKQQNIFKTNTAVGSSGIFGNQKPKQLTKTEFPSKP